MAPQSARQWSNVLRGLVIWILVIPTATAAQDTTVAGRPLPASLLRRLAEVTDGQGLADEVFVVANYRFPHDVAGSFRTRTEAARVASGIPGAGVFGPLRKVLPGATKFFVSGCHHDGIRSIYTFCPGNPVALNTVKTVTIITRFVNGDSTTVTVPAMKVDAMFFTLDAMDKFAFPYYAKLLGLEEANRLRREILDRLN